MLDTNIVVAGFLWSGPPRRLIEWASEGAAIELFSSAVLLDELADTLSYAKFATRINGSGTERAGTGATARVDDIAGHPTCGPKGSGQ